MSLSVNYFRFIGRVKYWCQNVMCAVTIVMPSAMGIPAQGMSAVQMQRTQQYKINPALRNPQQPVAAQPAPLTVRLLHTQTYIMYQIPYALFTSYHIVKTRRLSLAYLLMWQKLRLLHLCRSVDVSTQRISRLIAKQTGFNWGKFSMFRIISPKLLELFHTRTISQPWISAVKWHFLT